MHRNGRRSCNGSRLRNRYRRRLIRRRGDGWDSGGRGPLLTLLDTALHALSDGLLGHDAAHTLLCGEVAPLDVGASPVLGTRLGIGRKGERVNDCEPNFVDLSRQVVDYGPSLIDLLARHPKISRFRFERFSGVVVNPTQVHLIDAIAVESLLGVHEPLDVVE